MSELIDVYRKPLYAHIPTKLEVHVFFKRVELSMVVVTYKFLMRNDYKTVIIRIAICKNYEIIPAVHSAWLEILMMMD